MQASTLNPTQLSAPQTDLNSPFYPVPAGARAPGISMYDWLAAMAMQGLINHGMKVQADRAYTVAEKDAEMAQRAYQMAAAMMQVRGEVGPDPERPKG